MVGRVRFPVLTVRARTGEEHDVKKLNLKKETLADLSVDELRDIAGAVAADSRSCAITYTCVSCGECFNSFVCSGVGIVIGDC